MTVSVCLLVPGLASGFKGYDKALFSEAPALSRYLSRGHRRAFAACSMEEALPALFDLAVGGMSFPAAAFGYLGESGQRPEHYMLYADPVHLRADTHGLVLFDASAFSFSGEESEALSASVADFLKQDGWHLSAGNPYHWYLYADKHQDLATVPLSQAQGKQIGGLLPQGNDGQDWLKRLNEIQMLMYTHPVNQKRASEGLPVINSLWLWGGGELPTRTMSGFTRLYANNAVLKGLAVANDIDCAIVPDCADDLLAARQKNDSILVLLDACEEAAAYQQFQQWNDAIDGLEESWFRPLLAALGSRRIHSLELLPLDGYRYTARPGDLWRFWKRSRPYRSVLHLP